LRRCNAENHSFFLIDNLRQRFQNP
jgi:hypothetical protein